VSISNIQTVKKGAHANFAIVGVLHRYAIECCYQSQQNVETIGEADNCPSEETVSSPVNFICRCLHHSKAIRIFIT